LMTESANLTSLPPNFITDTTGGVSGLVPTPSSGNQVCYNGTVQTSTANVALLLYDNHAVYIQSTASAWSVYKSGSWVSTTDPRIVLTESPNGTTVTTVGPAIVDSILESWTLVNPTSQGMQIALNGAVDAATHQVIMLYYSNHTLYQENTANQWYSKTTSPSPWTATSDPRATPPPAPSTYTYTSTYSDTSA
jgi:hypothetical protein